MFNKLLIYLLWVAIAQWTSIQAEINYPKCIDEDGHPVDWYIAYKFPELSEVGYPFNSGYAYAYITSENVKGSKSFWSQSSHAFNNSLSSRFVGFLKDLGTGRNSGNVSMFRRSSNDNKPKDNETDLYWVISGKLITDRDSIVLRTLAIAYDSVHNNRRNNDKINSILYNDQPVERSANNSSRKRTSSSKAHAKGVLILDDITGNSIWLTHSTPQFPPPRSESLRFHENSKSYGQTFMCINFDMRQTGTQIVDHLINMRPLVYDSQISDRLRSLIPDIHELDSHKRNSRRNKKPTTKLAQKISTSAGESLYIYSKSADFGDDLYAGWIDNELQTALYVETWRNGAGTPLNSSCPRNTYHVNNVQDLKVIREGKKVTWSYHQDHSKWAISENKQSSIVCISDINRMQSQFKRGGGAVCIKCPSCWSVFSNTILDIEPCSLSKKPSTSNQS